MTTRQTPGDDRGSRGVQQMPRTSRRTLTRVLTQRSLARRPRRALCRRLLAGPPRRAAQPARAAGCAARMPATRRSTCAGPRATTGCRPRTACPVCEDGATDPRPVRVRRLLPDRRQRPGSGAQRASRARRGAPGVHGVRRRGLPGLRLELPRDLLRARHRRAGRRGAGRARRRARAGDHATTAPMNPRNFAPRPKQVLCGLLAALRRVRRPRRARLRPDHDPVADARSPPRRRRRSTTATATRCSPRLGLDQPHRRPAVAGAEVGAARRARRGGPPLLLRAGHLADRHRPGAVRSTCEAATSPRAARRSPSSTRRTPT